MKRLVIVFLISIFSYVEAQDGVLRTIEVYDWLGRLRRIEYYEGSKLNGESFFFNKKGICVKIIPYKNDEVKGLVYFFSDEGRVLGILLCGGHKTQVKYIYEDENRGAASIPRNSWYKPKHTEKIVYRWARKAPKRISKWVRGFNKDAKKMTKEEFFNKYHVYPVKCTW